MSPVGGKSLRTRPLIIREMLSGQRQSDGARFTEVAPRVRSPATPLKSSVDWPQEMASVASILLWSNIEAL